MKDSANFFKSDTKNEHRHKKNVSIFSDDPINNCELEVTLPQSINNDSNLSISMKNAKHGRGSSVVQDNIKKYKKNALINQNVKEVKNQDL